MFGRYKSSTITTTGSVGDGVSGGGVVGAGVEDVGSGVDEDTSFTYSPRAQSYRMSQ
jgi:hypothetical protein